MLCTCLSSFCGSNGVGNGTSKILTTRTAEESTLIVITATNSSQLTFGWLPTPFTQAAAWGIVNGDRSAEFIV